ncbi:MAG: hypothetical protein NXI31_04540 [bacterium]|nr:hypothetical protein [bacterium]
MTNLRIGLFGKGRLGAAIAERAGDAIAWQVTRDQPPDGVVDVAIEASAGAAVEQRIEWALATSTPLVIGSTGWDLPDLATRIGDRIGVVTAPNFSLGIALLRRFSLVLARFCNLDTSRDPYLVEHHHARKHDAPSGTAKLLADTMLAGCERKARWAMGGPLESDTLSVASIRAGSTYSDHIIGVDAPAEVIELKHHARSAAAFADGAIAAAKWIRDKSGVHTMDDVARAVLDPLFADQTRGGAS